MKSQTTIESLKYVVAKINLGWFCAVWALVILTPLIYFPAPGILAGHPWKVELATSLFLLFAIISLIKKNVLTISIPSEILFWIIIPICGFILWSSISIIWANSTLSVIHHTLLWANYLIFFILAINFVASQKLFAVFTESLGLIIGIIATICIIEYLFSEQIGEVFGYRYGRYTEIYAALFPFFIALILRLKRKNLILTGTITALVWVAILFSLSRGALFCSILGFLIFISMRIFNRPDSTEKIRLVIVTVAMILIVFLIQIPTFITDGQKVTTIARITTVNEDEQTNSVQQNVRYLFWKVGFDMFRDNLTTGVGADNFGSEFNKYLAIFSIDEANKSTVAPQESHLAERTHNEYLQILIELGLIGGIIFLLLLFGIGRFAFKELKNERAQKTNIQTHAAIAGLIVFLITSAFSSFSFRLMQNGLIFFFLLAVLLRNRIKKSRPNQISAFSRRYKVILVPAAIILCLSLTIYSSLKAISQFYVYQAEQEFNLAKAETYYQKAIILDPANGSANFSLGFRMFEANKYEAAASNFQAAVEKGLDTSIGYSLLATTQTLANKREEAEKTFTKALTIFPYSVFLRVRYAIALEKFNETAKAENQLEIARKINKKHAETWQVYIKEGEKAANEKAKTNLDLVSIYSLSPRQAVPTVRTEREILYPEERMKFNFNISQRK